MTTRKPTQRAVDLQRTRELWQQYVTLARRDCSFLYRVMLKRSADEAQARRYVAAFRADNGGSYPAGAPPEA